MAANPRHKRFECAIPFHGEVDDCQWQEMRAYDEQDAASDFAQKYDSDGDYTIIKRGDAEVWVKDAAGQITKWDIEAYSDPTYVATPKVTVSDRVTGSGDEKHD